jgi:hypothetical protein
MAETKREINELRTSKGESLYEVPHKISVPYVNNFELASYLIKNPNVSDPFGVEKRAMEKVSSAKVTGSNEKTFTHADWEYNQKIISILNLISSEDHVFTSEELKIVKPYVHYRTDSKGNVVYITESDEGLEFYNKHRYELDPGL